MIDSSVILLFLLMYAHCGKILTINLRLGLRLSISISFSSFFYSILLHPKLFTVYPVDAVSAFFKEQEMTVCRDKKGNNMHSETSVQ